MEVTVRLAEADEPKDLSWFSNNGDLTVYVAELENQVVGLFSVDQQSNSQRLEHFWLHPESLSQDIGTPLLEKAKEIAQRLQWSSLQWSSNPEAEGVCLRMGAKKVGVQRSMKDPNLFLPHLEYRF